jgi:lipopolysaccharide/colanic/teichoic acid biosynthesis glycosyltransferase
MHRTLAFVGAMLSLPIAILTAILIKLESRGPPSTNKSASAKRAPVYPDEVPLDARRC